MKKQRTTPLKPTFILLLFLMFQCLTSLAQKTPNIIYILADDLGWSELGSYGNRFNQTPQLDQLARSGMRLTQAYVPAPVCSPSRVGLLTGKHPAKAGITDFLDAKDEKYLFPDYITLNEQLGKAGYHTGLIGKWHLTGDYDKQKGSPDKHGWNEIISSETRYIAGGKYFYPYFFLPDLAAKSEGEYLTDRLNNEAVDFIKRNAKKPFFLYLSHYSVHTKLSGKPDKVARYKAKPEAGTDHNNPELAAMLESIDDGVGDIVKTLKSLGLDKNTLIIFTSDNGGESKVTSNAPLKGGKSQLYEGGIRIPMIVSWPGTVAADKLLDISVSTLDIFPTFTQIAGLPATDPKEYDGISILPALLGKSTLKPRNIFWHYPLAKPHFLGGRSAGAIRSGDYKLIEFFDNNTFELYNLKSDPGEKEELSQKMPEKTAELKAQLADWRSKLIPQQFP
jgi:arylsulfatase A